MDKPRLWLDCETTRLDHDRKPWDVAGILRPAGGNRADDQEFQWFVDIADLDLATADLKSLDVGRFWTRHPQAHIGADRDGRRGPSAGAAAVRRPEVCCPVRRHGQRFGGGAPDVLKLHGCRDLQDYATWRDLPHGDPPSAEYIEFREKNKTRTEEEQG